MGPGQEIGTVPLVASPITNDAQSASDVHTKVQKHSPQTDTNYPQHLVLTMRRYWRMEEVGMKLVVLAPEVHTCRRRIPPGIHQCSMAESQAWQ